MESFDSTRETTEAVASGAKKKRRSGARRKTGCYTCKARHARCDERKPVCSNCERLNLHCRPFEFITRSAWCSTTEAEVRSGVAGAGADDREVSSPTSPRSPRTPKSTFDIFNARIGDLAFIDEPVPPSSISSSSASSSFPFSAPGSTPPQQQLEIVPLNAEVAHLLSTYATGLATWMDIFDHTCAYQREVPRRCLTSELLMNCVCAFTAKHISLLPSGEIWSAVAARYYGDSLRMLIQCLNSSNPPESDALTATILLSSYEMLAAQGQEHQRHFYGAMTLIQVYGINAQCRGMDQANFWVYIRHEIAVALVNETPLQLSPKEWNVDWRERQIEEDALGNQLLWLVGRAVDIAYNPDPSSIPSTGRQDLHADAATWLESLPVTFQGVKYGEPDDLGFTKSYFAVPTAAAAMMWYHLLLILLCAEPTLQHSSHVSQIQYHASEIASIALSDVPQSVRSFSAQALYFAAKHINGIGKKTKLWTLLDDVEIRYGFRTRSRVQKLQRLAEMTI